MKPRIKYPSEKYNDWVFLCGCSKFWHQELIDRGIAPRYEFNADIMIPYCIDPNSGLTKYFEALY